MEVSVLFSVCVGGGGGSPGGWRGHSSTCWDRTSACRSALMEGRLLSS